MNKRNLTFIFLSGFWLHEVFTHVWLQLDGLLPFTSKMFFGYTITTEVNAGAILINCVLFLFFVYLGFFYRLESGVHGGKHALNKAA